MHKDKLETDFKGNRSIPDRGTSRSEKVSRKQNIQTAHHAPVRRAASKPEGTDNGPLTALEDAIGTHC
jgi:hypothetical protein